MPLQYILKEWQFRDLILKMKPPVFIPRPETEMLVEIVLSDMKHKKEHLNMLEICSGSGAISIALLKSIPTVRLVYIFILLFVFISSVDYDFRVLFFGNNFMATVIFLEFFCSFISNFCHYEAQNLINEMQNFMHSNFHLKVFCTK